MTYCSVLPGLLFASIVHLFGRDRTAARRYFERLLAPIGSACLPKCSPICKAMLEETAST
jgi:hypothetical protein